MSIDRDDRAGGKPQGGVGDSKPTMSASAIDRIAAELAALGETDVVDDELLEALQVDPLQSPEVRTVQTLVSLSRPLPEPLVRPLSELELARIYRRVAVRIPVAARAASEHHADAAPANTAPALRSSLWTTLTIVAAAAAFVLVPNLRGRDAGVDSAQRRADALESAEATGDAVRAGLSRLGPSGSARASALAQEYADRMGGGPQ